MLTRLLFILLFASSIVCAQELESLDTNSVPATETITESSPVPVTGETPDTDIIPDAGDSPGTEDTPGTDIELPVIEPPETPKATPTKPDLRKDYLSIKGAHSTTPVGPTMIKLKEPPADTGEKSPWNRSLEFGLSVNRGNSDSELYLLRIEITRKDDLSEFIVSAAGQYGENDDTRNREAAQGRIRYSRDLTTSTYQAFDVRGYYDALADLDYQIIATWSYGLRLIHKKDSFLAIEAGPGYVEEKKQGETANYFAAHLAERGEVSFNDSVLIWHAFDYFPSLDNSKRYLITAEAGVESVLGRNLRFRAALQDRYDNTPAPDKKKNDLATILSLVLNF